MQDVLRIGIDKLLDETEQMDYAKIDFATILGETDKHGHWLDIKEKREEEEEKMDTTPSDSSKDNNMYMFEGVDYRSTYQKADVDLFDRLTHQNADDDDDDEQRNLTGTSSSERRVSERPTRRPLTEEEKTARTKKMRETKARRKQEMVRYSHLIVLFSLYIFRKKPRNEVKNDERQNCNNYGQRIIIVHVEFLNQMMKMILQMTPFLPRPKVNSQKRSKKIFIVF